MIECSNKEKGQCNFRLWRHDIKLGERCPRDGCTGVITLNGAEPNERPDWTISRVTGYLRYFDKPTQVQMLREGGLPERLQVSTVEWLRRKRQMEYEARQQMMTRPPQPQPAFAVCGDAARRRVEVLIPHNSGWTVEIKSA